MAFMDRNGVSGVPLRDERRARLVRATLRMASGTVIPVVVRNLSEQGLGVTCKSAPPSVGEVVHITLPGSRQMQGVVRWRRATALGIELTGSVDANSITEAIQQEIARAQVATDWKVSSLHRTTTPAAPGPRRRI